MNALLAKNKAFARFKRLHATIAASSKMAGLPSDDGLFFVERSQTQGPFAHIGGRAVLNYSSYDYFGFAKNPRVIAAASHALQNYGTGASASRVSGGQLAVHTELENRIAQFLGTESSLTFNAGYLTNVTAIGFLFGPNDLIVHDSLIHRSAVEGIASSGAAHMPFAHNDMESLKQVLATHRHEYRSVLICVEGVYSADGDLVNLPEVIALKKEFDCFVMVDEAHSLGVIGATGKGIAEHWGVAREEVDLWMGTLSKTLAGCGGYIAGDTELVDYLRYNCPGFVYSAAMPAASAAASNEALKLLQEDPSRVVQLQALATQSHAYAQSLGLDTGTAASTAVMPILIYDEKLCFHLSCHLWRHDILVHALCFPIVPMGQARLRFFLNTEISKEQVFEALKLLKAEIQATSAQ